MLEHDYIYVLAAWLWKDFVYRLPLWWTPVSKMCSFRACNFMSFVKPETPQVALGLLYVHLSIDFASTHHLFSLKEACEVAGIRAGNVSSGFRGALSRTGLR